MRTFVKKGRDNVKLTLEVGHHVLLAALAALSRLGQRGLALARLAPEAR